MQWWANIVRCPMHAEKLIHNSVTAQFLLSVIIVTLPFCLVLDQSNFLFSGIHRLAISTFLQRNKRAFACFAKSTHHGLRKTCIVLGGSLNSSHHSQIITVQFSVLGMYWEGYRSTRHISTHQSWHVISWLFSNRVRVISVTNRWF